MYRSLFLDKLHVPIDPEQFWMGMNVELEHGHKLSKRGPTNVTRDSAKLTGMITTAHLIEIPDYYTRLARMERQAEGKTRRRTRRSRRAKAR